MSENVGRVLGTLDAMPLEFWVAVEEGQYLQLDDVVEVATPLPDGTEIRLFGVVDLVRARHEGARFDSDVFLVERGVLPASVAHAAHVKVTRVEPEIFVPPRPGQAVRRATGLRRDQALFFDGMERKVPIGLSRDGEPVFANLDFLDGSRGAHVNISGISGVATKTSYATFLLHSLFTSGALGGDAANTHALVFNVKGEDLLFLDQPNAKLQDEDRAAYARLGLPAEPFGSAQFLAPVRKGSAGAPARHREPRRGGRRPSSGRSARWCRSASCASSSPRPTTRPASSASWWTGSRRSSRRPRPRRARRRTPGSRSRARGSRPSTRWSRRSPTTRTGTRASPSGGRGRPPPGRWPPSSGGCTPRRSTSGT